MGDNDGNDEVVASGVVNAPEISERRVSDGSYEDGLTFVQHMIAGSIAGTTEHMAMFPVDTVKTRMQAMRQAASPVPGDPPSQPSALRTPVDFSTRAESGSTSSRPPPPPRKGAPPFRPGLVPRPSAAAALSQAFAGVSSAPSGMGAVYQAMQCGAGSVAIPGGSEPSVYRALTQILKLEGPAGLYRGIGAMGLGAGPAHAVYFAVYELAKQWLGGNERGHRPLAHAAAGALATVASDAVLTPMDVVKQRLQLRRSPYSGVVDCCRQVMEKEGLRAFYTSYRTTLVMNVPFTAVHFATYEAAKRVLEGMGSPEAADEDHLLTHLVAGGAAGALASAVTNPLDVIKTRLQCQGVCGVRRFQSGSVVGAMRSLVREEGPRVLLRGIGARVMFHTPAAAICWSTYEACKSFLRRRWGRDQG